MDPQQRIFLECAWSALEEIPPSLHYEQANPSIHFEDTPFYVNTALRSWKRGPIPRRAGVSSFGIGGTKAHAILERRRCCAGATRARGLSRL